MGKGVCSSVPVLSRASYNPCNLCPRSCGIERTAERRGFCGETGELRIAAATIHRGEEPPITGSGGSGTIFVTGCNLGCVFCQNYQISQKGMGRVVDDGEFARICLALQERGAENINVVTGSHTAPSLVSSLTKARDQGLNIPVLWNSSAYESPEILSLVGDIVDVYLPDLKTLDKAVSGRFFNAPDYPDCAEAAILRMMENRELRYNENGTLLVSGVMIRHLVIPGFLEATRDVLRWFAENAKGRALLSLLTQYTPVDGGSLAPARYVSEEEYNAVTDWLEEFGINDGFYQELAADSGWLPEFDRLNPFSSDLSIPVWHWREGFIPSLRVV
jgi:putative pyruvate formate lyase activating enzyme